MRSARVCRALVIATATLLGACGGGSGGGGNPGGGPAPGGQAALQAEIDRVFPFTANQPFDITFACTIGNVPGILRSRPDASGNDTPYYLDFHSTPVAGQTYAFDVNYELDDSARSHLGFSGTYTYGNGQIQIDVNTSVFLPFLPPGQQNLAVVLSEISTRIDPHLGLVAYFETHGANPLACRATGHRYNANEAADTINYTRVPHYECQPFAIANTQEQNTFEFASAEMPLPATRNTPVPPNTWVHLGGSFFRQREIGATPLIARGSGLYRRDGGTFYADFGPGVFDDFALLKGTINPFNVEQFGAAENPCAFSLR